MKHYNDEVQRSLKSRSLDQLLEAYAGTIDRQREEIRRFKVRINKLEQKLNKK